MPNNTWKNYERRLARSFGVERAPGSHGPDFVVPIGDEQFRAEAKKRSSASGFKIIMGWLMARDILFIGLTNQRDDESLVVMRKRTFDRLYQIAKGGAHAERPEEAITETAAPME